MSNPFNNVNGLLAKIAGGSASPKAFTQLEKYLAEIRIEGDTGPGNVLTAVYQETSAADIKDFIRKNPCAPVVVSNNGQLYTAIYAGELSNNRIMLRTIGTISGVYNWFSYTISGSTWAVTTQEVAGAGDQIYIADPATTTFSDLEQAYIDDKIVAVAAPEQVSPYLTSAIQYIDGTYYLFFVSADVEVPPFPPGEEPPGPEVVPYLGVWEVHADDSWTYRQITIPDMDDVRSVVEEGTAQTFGSPFRTGTLIDRLGAKYEIWCKIVDTGQLPDTATKTVAHDLPANAGIWKIEGLASSSNNNVPLPLSAQDNYQIYVGVGPSNITITTYRDRSSFTRSHVSIYFLKEVQ